jgi:pre-mRNA 3'-end-processing factor FIP1
MSGPVRTDQTLQDIEIIIDKPPTAPKPTQQQPQESKAIKIEPPSQATSAPAQAPKAVPGGTVAQLSTAAGTSYPAQRTSTVDVNSNPVYPPQGKPLLQVDMDADLAEEQKIWRRPGEDQSDYFNYGFDEFTWETYRQRQLTMANTIQQQKNDIVQMQQMMGGGMPSMPGPPAPSGPPTGPGGGGPGGGGGMNEQAFQQMVSQGMDPSQMDFGSFMQMAGQGMGGGFGGPGGPGGGPQGGFQQGNQGGGGGRGGRGRGRGW